MGIRDMIWRKKKKAKAKKEETVVTDRVKRLLVRERALSDKVAKLTALDEKLKFGIRITQPSLTHSAPPLTVLDGYLVTKREYQKCDIFPDTRYPIPWTPPETWRSMFEAILTKETAKLQMLIPIGISKSRMGYLKGHSLEAAIPASIADIPYGLGRIGVIGHRSFNINVVSSDFDTRLAYTQRALDIEKVLRQADRTAFADVIDLVRKKTDIEKHAFLQDYWSYIAQGQTGEPEKLVRKIVEAATKKGDEMKG